MAKLKDTEILTRQVYLNIESEERGEVETRGMATKDAISEYGELEVIEVGEPQYSSESTDASTAASTAAPKGKRGKREEQDPRKPGSTAVRLKAAE